MQTATAKRNLGKAVAHTTTSVWSLRSTATNFREALEPGLKLAVTLRHLATGASYTDLIYSFRVGKNTLSKCVPEVLEAIIQEYSEEVLPAEQWQQIAKTFEQSGTSLMSAGLLMLFNNTELRGMLEENNLGLPNPDPLPGDDKNTPYFLVGDDAFPLRTWMMKQSSRRNLTNEERIFNYRLSRARRVVENAFGLLAMRFQCLLGYLNQTHETVDSIILACVTLQNLIRIRFPAIAGLAVDQDDENKHLVPGEWRNGRQLADGDRSHGRNVATSAEICQRDYIKQYFNFPAGSVEWQQNMI